MDQSIISTLLELLQTERNNISKYKNQKGQKSNYDSYLSLLVLIFCRHALKPLLLPLAKTDTGLAAFVCCVPHVAHITVCQMVHDSPLASPHHFIQHLALWGRLQAPVEVCDAARCNTSRRGPSARRRQSALAGLRLSSPRSSSCINICPQLCRMQTGSFSFSRGEGLVLCFVFLCMVRNGRTRA